MVLHCSDPCGGKGSAFDGDALGDGVNGATQANRTPVHGDADMVRGANGLPNQCRLNPDTLVCK